MLKVNKKLVIALGIILVFLTGTASVFAETFSIQNEPKKIRVGFYHIDGFNEMDADGTKSGYGYEVLQTMKLYANWTYEYVGYDKGWADIQQMLQNGEIDMVISAVKTPEREKLYGFSERSVSKSGACLLIKKETTKYIAGQYQTYRGMRIGFIENSSQIASAAQFAQEKGFDYTPVYYKTSSELENAIISGKAIDAIVTSNMRLIKGTRRLDLFAMQDVHAMVKKNNTALLKEINFVLEQISLYNPSLYDSLYNKYYSINAINEIFFSPEEISFINQCKNSGIVLHVALVPDMSPYSFFNKRKLSGIFHDISMEILRRTGLPFEIETVQDETQYWKLIKDKKIDIRLAARYDYNEGEQFGYTLTHPYYSTDISRITKKNDDDDIKTVALVKDNLIGQYYKKTLKNGEKILEFDSVHDCVQAVMEDTCDAFFTYTRAAQEIVYNDQTNRLTSIVMPGYTESFSIGVRDDLDRRFASLLEKAVTSLSDEDISNIELRYANYKIRSLSFVGMIYNSPIIFITIVVISLLLIFTILLFALSIHKRSLEREKNRQLERALAAAKEANSAKSVFMSRMSHEIRTPLNAIIGYNTISTSTLNEAKTESSYKIAVMKVLDCLTKTDIASKHLLSVINDVLDMSAIESGKIKITHDGFDFKKLITSITVLFYSQAKEKGITFEMNFNSLTEEWYIGDEMRISQVITNLLSNAVKFTQKNGKIRCRIWQTKNTNGTAETVGDEKKTIIHFEVSDTGIGMKSDFLANIWTPFEQADSSISRRFGGTGLGLSITKNLVDLMGGTISVKSELNCGSTFTVSMPLERMKQPENAYMYDFSAMNVLVVDDDQSTCDYLLTLLDRCGSAASSVTSGVDAVLAVHEAIQRNMPYTVCIVDWQMPQMNGLETIRKIREIAGSEIPIIIISAYDFSEIASDAEKLGVHSFAPKPLFQSTVFDLLATAAGKQVSKRPSVSKEKTIDFHGTRILFAEDNVMNMEIANTILTGWNISVDKAWNGEEAVNMFCSSPEGTYKAVLMDVHMPKLDGYSATKQIRAATHKDAAVVPIIAMTADAFSEDVAEALTAGMNAHIAKPIDTKVLLETMQKYLEQQ